MGSLKAGDWVEVRSREEILATLDEKGCLESLPFMPEMLQFCGKRFRVYKSAHKACDTIVRNENRRMKDAVHLEGLRCDGAAHGGCQAGCLIHWKTAWLRPVDSAAEAPASAALGCDLEALEAATRPEPDGSSEERYRCQATEMYRATSPMRWWDPRHYIEDLATRNVRLRDMLWFGAIAFWNIVQRFIQRGRPYPFVWGRAPDKTPTLKLDLQPGELVQVRSWHEIMQTLSDGHKNRGLWFDVEMVPFCGKTFRVLRRVERIVNEKTGVLNRFNTDCIILEGVACGGCFSKERMFCPRSIYPWWREIWLKRVESA